MSRDIERLTATAALVRRDILEMTYRAQSGHIGGSFSIVEALTALYFHAMRVTPGRPDDPGRDRFVLSKGHAAPALYAVLARAGFFPRDYLFTSFRCLNGHLQGHPSMRKTPGVDMSGGSLGTGLSAANGMALAARVQNRDFRVYCLIGDGEIDEGQIWEAAETASHFALDNLTTFIDVNGLQNDGPTREVMGKGDIAGKWRAFGWRVREIDGHDFAQLLDALDEARNSSGRPFAIVQRTVKGKGVSFMENAVDWHAKAPTKEEYEAALKELGE